MRDYAKVSPAFWMTGSGKALRGCPEAQIIGLYLVTCPSSNMIGLYYLPKALLIHETGLTTEGACKGLARASEAGFAYYDEVAELVWVPNAAAYQIGETLTGKDKRKEGVLRELETYRKHRFTKQFFAKYREAYELTEPAWFGSPFEVPCKPLRSQEQEQEQDQEQDPPLPPEGETEEMGGRPALRESGTLPASERVLWGKRWVEVYEAAVTASVGHEWAFERRQLSELEHAIDKFCRDKTRIEEWIERAVREFVKSTRADEPKLWSSHQPKGLRRWFNEGRPGFNSTATDSPAVVAERAKREEARRQAERDAVGPTDEFKAIAATIGRSPRPSNRGAA